jgi:hypothetical protein
MPKNIPQTSIVFMLCATFGVIVGGLGVVGIFVYDPLKGLAMAVMGILGIGLFHARATM